ncbi:hypothetical protein ILYODFUR_031803 [Ilyodon furcidens]|uniref:Uncharacterized protein n=1 Tax=Ilyodon furcidens TaxID=33524 RepID=A0ABV0TPI6_9TELE
MFIKFITNLADASIQMRTAVKIKAINKLLRRKTGSLVLSEVMVQEQSAGIEGNAASEEQRLQEFLEDRQALVLSVGHSTILEQPMKKVYIVMGACNFHHGLTKPQIILPNRLSSIFYHMYIFTPTAFTLLSPSEPLNLFK